MDQHPYLRAYMAGIALPTAFLIVGLTIFCILRFGLDVPVAIDRAIVFPMAVVPNVFGLWNMLFVKLHPHWRTPIGLHGAALPFFLGPLGAVSGSALGFIEFTRQGVRYFGFVHIPYWYFIFLPFLGIAAYYLVWKYVVGFLNRLVGLPS